MRKLLLLFVLSFSLIPVVLKAQGIGLTRIQFQNPGVSSDLELVTEVMIQSQPAFRITNSSRISQDTLYVTACYYAGMAAATILVKDTIQLGTLPSNITTLHFKIRTSLSATQCININSATKIQPFQIAALLGDKTFFADSNYSIYPNPVSDFLFLKDQTIQTISIRDLAGKVIKNYQFQNEAANKLDVRSLKSGIYLLEIVSKDGQSYVQKFLKN